MQSFAGFSEDEVNGRVTAGSVQAFIGNVAGFIEDFAMPRPLDRACEFIAQERVSARRVSYAVSFPQGQQRSPVVEDALEHTHALRPGVVYVGQSF